MSGDGMIPERDGQLIGQMIRAERTLPDEFWHTAAAQELAAVIARYEAIMTDEHLASLIGVGAMLIRHGKREMSAEIQARMALARAARP